MSAWVALLKDAQSDVRRRTTIELSNREIRSRLGNTEDSTVERKVASDYRDCLKTAVGFSNSLPVGDPGIIFVGVFDDGRVQDRNNLDSLEKDISKEISKVYPPIFPQMKVMAEGGKEFIAIIVRGSATGHISLGKRIFALARRQYLLPRINFRALSPKGI